MSKRRIQLGAPSETKDRFSYAGIEKEDTRKMYRSKLWNHHYFWQYHEAMFQAYVPWMEGIQDKQASCSGALCERCWRGIQEFTITPRYDVSTTK